MEPANINSSDHGLRFIPITVADHGGVNTFHGPSFSDVVNSSLFTNVQIKSSMSVQSQQHGKQGQHQEQPISSKSDSSVEHASMQVPVLNPQLRNAVLSVVHKERSSIQKRSKNVVVRGLKASISGNDTVLASNIINEQLGVCVDIVNTRRLGQPGNGAVQPLLVVFGNSKDADLVLLHANDLRSAADEYVRTKVYINVDRTPAEAKAAYEQRCLRRQRGFVSSDLQCQRQRADHQYSSQSGDHQQDQTLDRRHDQQERNQRCDQSRGCSRNSDFDLNYDQPQPQPRLFWLKPPTAVVRQSTLTTAVVAEVSTVATTTSMATTAAQQPLNSLDSDNCSVGQLPPSTPKSSLESSTQSFTVNNGA